MMTIMKRGEIFGLYFLFEYWDLNSEPHMLMLVRQELYHLSHSTNPGKNISGANF
jgi:hypothetical protein